MEPHAGPHLTGCTNLRKPALGFRQLAAVTYCATALHGYFFLALALELGGIESRLPVLLFRALLLGTAILLCLALGPRSRALMCAHFFLFLLFWCLYSLRLVPDVFRPGAPLDRPPAEYLLHAYGVCFLPAMAFACALEHVPHRLLLRGLLVTSALTTVGSFAYFLTEPPPNYGRFSIGERVNPISTGYMAGTAILLTLIAFQTLSPKRFPFRALLYFTAAAGSVLLVVSASRGPLLATLSAGLVLFSALRFPPARAVLVKPMVAAILAATGAAIIAAAEGFAADRLRISALLDALSWEERPLLWQNALRAFFEQPLTGSGFLLENGSYPHNLILESFMATGLLGGLLFLYLFLRALIRAVRFGMRPSEHQVPGILFIQAAALSMFSGALFNSPFFWYFLLAANTLPGNLPSRTTPAQPRAPHRRTIQHSAASHSPITT